MCYLSKSSNVKGRSPFWQRRQTAEMKYKGRVCLVKLQGHAQTSQNNLSSTGPLKVSSPNSWSNLQQIRFTRQSHEQSLQRWKLPSLCQCKKSFPSIQSQTSHFSYSRACSLSVCASSPDSASITSLCSQWRWRRSSHGERCLCSVAVSQVGPSASTSFGSASRGVLSGWDIQLLVG